MLEPTPPRSAASCRASKASRPSRHELFTRAEQHLAHDGNDENIMKLRIDSSFLSNYVCMHVHTNCLTSKQAFNLSKLLDIELSILLELTSSPVFWTLRASSILLAQASNGFLLRIPHAFPVSSNSALDQRKSKHGTILHNGKLKN